MNEEEKLAALEAELEKVREPFWILCAQCGRRVEMQISKYDFSRWKEQGVSPQEAFPYLTPGEREMFISRTCEPCFDAMFPPDEEEAP